MSVTPANTPPLEQVRALPAGDIITGFYLLGKIETRKKKDGNPFLTMSLQDATGSLEAKMWDSFAEFYAGAKSGDVVKVEGRVDHFGGNPQLVVSRIRLATEEEVPDRTQFMPHSPLSAEDAKQLLSELLESIENPNLKAAVAAVYDDPDFLERFLAAPGGKKWHHPTLGGLAEHTISLAKLADQVGQLYDSVDRDLLVSGALLHDIGKVWELSVDLAFDYTAEGRLLGHIVQGTMFLDQKLREIPDFPEETRRQLIHLILSHQGDPSMGSPVKPATLEALVLHYCDQIDSRISAFLRERESAEGQDFSWIKLMEQFFYYRKIDDWQTSDEGDNRDNA
jgi:3'-5' exoribonuclease